MLYTVHWKINDGRFGYPNIQADPASSDVFCRTYEEAIRAHAKIKDVHKILSISPTTQKGKISGRNYRDFLVCYLAKGVVLEKAFYISGEVVSKIVRVFGSCSGKSVSL